MNKVRCNTCEKELLLEEVKNFIIKGCCSQQKIPLCIQCWKKAYGIKPKT